MRVSKLSFNGRIPSATEFDALTSIPYEKAPISDVERSSIIKRGLFNLMLAGVCVVIGVICIAIFRATTSGAGHGFVGFLGVLALIASPIMVLAGIFTFFGIASDPRRKSPQAALLTYVQRVIVGDDDIADFRKKDIEYAFSVMQRMQPQSRALAHEATTAYLKDIRARLEGELLAGYKETFNREPTDFGVCALGALTEPPASSEELAPGIMRQHAFYALTGSVNQTVGNKSKTMYYAQIKLDLDMVLVKAGDHWFVYDPTPTCELVG